MPVYCYRCEKCGHGDERLRKVEERDRVYHCPSCLKDGAWATMKRDILGEHVNSTDQEYARPIFSEALGVRPDQVKDAQRRFPHHEFHPDGRMIIRSHASRNRIMRELGFFDRDGYN